MACGVRLIPSGLLVCNEECKISLESVKAYKLADSVDWMRRWTFSGEPDLCVIGTASWMVISKQSWHVIIESKSMGDSTKLEEKD